MIRTRIWFFVFLLCSGINTVFGNNTQSDSLDLQKLLEAGLPVVQIETVNHEEPSYEEADAPEGCMGASIKNATKVPGRLFIETSEGVVYDSGNYFEKDSVVNDSGMTVKVRGNTSARYRVKTPYKVKLQQKADLLGRGDNRYKDKDWLLLSFHNLNTVIGFKINELLGMQWTPQYMPVNLVMNGTYRGLYLLTEAVERNADCRLDVDKSTGYIMELDAYWWNEELYLPSTLPESMNYTFKYPDADKVTEEQKAYIHEVLLKAEQAMIDGNYGELIDVESFARWMLGHDILGNVDGCGSNIFMTKYDNTPESLLKMANMWDFDGVLESNDDWSAGHYNNYFQWLFSCEDKSFTRAYTMVWEEVKDSVFPRLYHFLDSLASSPMGKAMEASVILNNAQLKDSMPSIADYVRADTVYFDQRKNWLDSAIVSISGTTLTAENYTRLYGDPNPVFSYVADGVFLGGEPVLECMADSLSPVGTYPIRIRKGSVANRNVSLVDGTLTVLKAPLYVSVSDMIIAKGDSVPGSFVLTFDGFRNGDNADSLSIIPYAYTDATTDSEEGTYQIYVVATDDSNYEIHVSNGLLTIVGEVVGVCLPKEDDTLPLKVFTPTGMRVSSSPSSLKHLRKGIYIVNGKKVIL